MTIDDSRGGQHGAIHPSNPTDEVDEEAISLRPLIYALWSYRYITAAAVSGILILFLLWGTWTYVSQPAERQARIEFRLLFDGADRGEYPNGLVFSRAEIIGTPVLTEVYEINELERYITYESFKNALFILEANRELELLGFEYQAKLADPAVTPVDRARLEGEFRSQGEALQLAQYGLNFISSNSEIAIPTVLLNKVLNDVLAVWTEQAATRKGVLKYQVNVFTKNLVFKEFLEADDYIVRIDILRGKINRVLDSLSALENLPGASSMRAGENRISLAEIRVNLEDLVTYRLEPLMENVWVNGLTRDVDNLESYLQNRQFQITLDLQEAEGRARVIEDSLRIYLADGRTPARGSGVGGDGGAVTGEPLAGMTTTLIPQIGDSFLDRIMALGGETSDLQYRQELTDLILVAKQRMVGLTRETNYYSRWDESLRRLSSSPSEEIVRRVEARFTEVYDGVIQALEQSNAIYAELSAQNLNPRTNLFTITSPFTTTILRTVTMRTLRLYGLVALILSFIVVPLACLLHHYFRREILSARHARQPDVP